MFKTSQRGRILCISLPLFEHEYISFKDMNKGTEKRLKAEW